MIINIFGFMFLYLGLLMVSTPVMTLMGLDLVTVFSSVAASIGNIDPAPGMVGPAGSYAGIPPAGK